MAMRIGVLGGTFDPIHVGHVAKAKQAQAQLDLDCILFTVAGDPWMKRSESRRITPAAHRLEMVRLALSSHPGLDADDRELLRSGPTYTADTLEGLASENPGVHLYLLVGSDCLPSLPQWSRPERVLDLATVTVMERPGAEIDLGPLEKVRAGASAQADILCGQPVGLSSSELRCSMAAGRQPRGALDHAVARYIERHGLYVDRGHSGGGRTD